MVGIEYYHADGAAWQAKMVLAYLQGHNENIIEGSWNRETGRYEAEIKVGRFENGREQGYVVSVSAGDATRCWAFYEHRNSDQIHVLVSRRDLGRYVDDTPSVSFMWNAENEPERSKYDTDKHFAYNEAFQCGEWLAGEMQRFIWAKIKKSSDD